MLANALGPKHIALYVVLAVIVVVAIAIGAWYAAGRRST
jgi:hypothetical protein